MGSDKIPHFVLFPFLSQGHIIPTLYLGRLLRHHAATVTVFTTAGNDSTVKAYLHDTDINVIVLPFPQIIDGVPAGVENTHDLRSMESFIPFANATKSMQTSFEEALQIIQPPVTAVISDFFLGWTLFSAKKFNIPRYAFSGMSNFSSTITQAVVFQKPHAETKSYDEEFVLPDFPEIKLTRNDFDPPFNEIDPSGPFADFIAEQAMAMEMSQGVLINSVYELEKDFADYWNQKLGPKAITVGPFCLAAAVPPSPPSTASYIKFLDEKQSNGESVLYVAFGTQAVISTEQIREIALGLEKSGVNFLWAVRLTIKDEFFQSFENRVKNRGVVISEWVDQLQILRHGGVTGFLSHCGWNSAIESITAGVPILAMPIMAEQHLNARFVADIAGVGLRVMAEGGSLRGFVTADEIETKVRRLMVDEEGEVLRQKAIELGRIARDAVSEGGSSFRTLHLLVNGTNDTNDN